MKPLTPRRSSLTVLVRTSFATTFRRIVMWFRMMTVEALLQKAEASFSLLYVACKQLPTGSKCDNEINYASVSVVCRLSIFKNTVAYLLKARIVKPPETAVVRERLFKHTGF
jgi:hypothetical protein